MVSTLEWTDIQEGLIRATDKHKTHNKIAC